MLRFILPALLAACALPAVAQHCEITRPGESSPVATANITGTAATLITAEFGPTFTPLALYPEGIANGYSLHDGDKVALYLYRIGKSQDGKDWREPGSIATTDAGFAIEWPRILHNGKTVPSIRVRLGADIARVGDIIWVKGEQKRDGAVMRFTEDLPVPRNFSRIVYGEDELEYHYIQREWMEAFPKDTAVSVEFYDGKSGNRIGKISLPYPAFDVRQKQLVEDVTALRAAFAAGKCK